MQIATRFWGTLDLPEEALITMTREILGFPQHRRFILLPDGTGSPFLYLQSAEDQNLAFVTLDPLLIDPEYLVPPEDVPDLGNPEDWAVLVLCTINRTERVATANLRSPVIINRVSREGGQVVLSAPYSFQHPLVPEGA